MQMKVLALGIFDGVHAGHQQIIKTAKHLGEVTVMTFDPHPTSVVAPERTPSQLISVKDRIELLKQVGATHVEVVNFNKDFSQLSPDQFIEDVKKVVKTNMDFKKFLPWIIVGVIMLFAIMSYNGLVGVQADTKTAWSKVESSYQRRNDLIDNLVSTVKGSADFEKSTLEAVTNARAKATSINL